VNLDIAPFCTHTRRVEGSTQGKLPFKIILHAFNTILFSTLRLNNPSLSLADDNVAKQEIRPGGAAIHTREKALNLNSNI
jgi:hypothetical protein